MPGNDLHHALRLLVRTPAFTIPALASLALGIAVNTTMFGVVNALLVRPLAGHGPDTLVRIGRSMHGDGSFRSVSHEEFELLERHTSSFSAIVGNQIAAVAVSAPDGLHFASGEIVTSNYFEALALPPALGRGFDRRAAGDDRAVVLSDRFWRRGFGADPAVVGRSVSVNRQPFTVVGVAPPGFTGMFPGVAADVWLPSLRTAAAARTDPRAQDSLLVMAVLKRGVSMATARAELETLARRTSEIDPGHDPARGLVLAEARGVHPGIAQGIRPFALAMMGIAGVVLLMVCANVAGLLLARASARRPEFAVRLALGAPRRRIVRQLLVESLVLAVAGAAGGLAATWWALEAINAVTMVPGPTGAPVFLDLTVDWRVLAFAAAAAVVTTIAFGLIPALQGTRIELMSILRDARTSPGRRRARLRGALVIVQVTVSIVLITGAVLLFRSVRNSARIDLGFDPDRVAVASFDLVPLGYGREQSTVFYGELLRRARGLPGVERASLARLVPMAGRGSPVTVVDPARPDGIRLSAAHNRVSDDYFATVGQPLVRGRDFTPGDRARAPGAAIVNEAMARRLWPGADAIGRRIRLVEPGPGDAGSEREIVGVVRDARYASFSGGIGPFLFLPAFDSAGAQTLHVRAASVPSAVLEDVRALAREIDPGAAPRRDGTLREAMSFALVPARIGGTVFGAAGVIALLLAAGGLYGLVSYSLEQRAKEVGIRVALGADRRAVFRLLVGGTLRLALTGVGLGVPLAAGAMRLLSGLLIGLGPGDPPTYAGIAMLMAGVTLGAGYLAARKGLRMDPVAVLKHE